MADSQIFEKTRDVIVEHFKEDPGNIFPDTKLMSLNNFDSLEYITLFLKIEKEFNVKFSMQELLAMESAGGIAEKISEKLKG